MPHHKSHVPGTCPVSLMDARRTVDTGRPDYGMARS